MDELLRQLMDHLRAMWHRRWIGLGVAWLVALIAGAVVLRMPDQYEASARVYVDTATLLRPLMSGIAVQLDTDQQIAMLGKTIISRPNVERLIRMADLEVRVTSQREREALIESLMKDLKIGGATRDARDNLYQIWFRDSKPEEAKKIVQGLLSIFVESSLGDKRRDTDTARKFLDDQIKIYEKRLEEAENRVKEFKLKNMALTGGEGKDYFGRMGQMQEDLQKARLELRAAEESRDALKKELAGETPVFLPEPRGAGSPESAPHVGAITVPEIDARLDSLKKQLDELQRRYTDQHPDVTGTKRIIESLEKQRKDEVEARRVAAETTAKAAAEAAAKGGIAARASPVDRNPVFQQLKVQLAESEATVAALRARVGEYEARVKALGAAARQLPQVEAELAQLNRDYDVQKKQYEALVQRRESAALGGEIDATGSAEFKVIDPPRVSPQPVAPNRLLLMTFAFLGGLAAGLAASFLASQIAPTFHDTRALRELLKRPVLGSVSLIAQPAVLRQRRRGLLAFIGGIGGFVAAYGAALALVFIAVKPF